MKIKNLLKAPLILQKAKELNIDLSTLDPNTRVKLIEGGLHFEGEKECFVSKAISIENVRYLANQKGYNVFAEKNIYTKEFGYSVKKGDKQVRFFTELLDAYKYLQELDDDYSKKYNS